MNDARINATLAGFVDLLPDAVCLVDAQGLYVFVSAAYERIFGYSPEEVIGLPVLEFVFPQDRIRTSETIRGIMNGKAVFNFENRYLHKSGRIIHVRWSARWSERDQMRIAVAHDITEHKQSESVQSTIYAISEAVHSAEDLQSLFQHIHSIIGALMPAANFALAICDENSRTPEFVYQTDNYNEAPEIKNASQLAFCSEIMKTRRSLLYYSNQPSTGSRSLDMLDNSTAVCWLGVPLNTAKGVLGTIILKSYTDDYRYTESDKDLLQFVSSQIVTAIERKRFQDRLQYMAQYDDLTGLPKRALLFDRMELALARTRRQNGLLAILYLDMNNFKSVNDSMGHAAGDLLLKEIANRLKQCVRMSDTVARVGGDEFVILLENIQKPNDSTLVADKIQNVLSEPVLLDEKSIRITLSIGTALYPGDGENVNQLLKHADTNMYVDKKTMGF